MKTEEITENNRLIAEFMGTSFCPYNSKTVQGLNWKLIEKKHGHGNNGFMFHSSWDWLMPVVEKISKIVGYKSVDECTNDEWFVTANLMQSTISTPIHIIYANVVLFIKWYNENK